MTEEKKKIWWRKSSSTNVSVDVHSGRPREIETVSEHAYYGGQFVGSKPEDRTHLGAVVWQPEEGKPNSYNAYVQKIFDDLDAAKKFVERAGMIEMRKNEKKKNV